LHLAFEIDKKTLPTKGRMMASYLYLSLLPTPSTLHSYPLEPTGRISTSSPSFKTLSEVKILPFLITKAVWGMKLSLFKSCFTVSDFSIVISFPSGKNLMRLLLNLNNLRISNLQVALLPRNW